MENDSKTSTEGKLSSRMTQEDNLWRKCWSESQALPVRKQKPIFQFVLEAEKVLHYLETISPSFLIQE